MKLFTIPNFLTLGNLFCGCMSILFLSGYFETDSLTTAKMVLLLMSVSLLFDLLDGMVARALKINSELGIQLDSLADMVSFGLVPGMMMFLMIQNSIEQNLGWLSFVGFLVTLFSALRLAKFNIDTEQSTYFKGLATPANTIFVFSLFWIQAENSQIIGTMDWLLLLGLSIACSFMLIADLPLFSFKLKGFGWKDNHFKYIFLIISMILLVLFQIKALAFIILLYIIISIIFRKKIKDA